MGGGAGRKGGGEVGGGRGLGEHGHGGESGRKKVLVCAREFVRARPRVRVCVCVCVCVCEGLVKTARNVWWTGWMITKM